MFVILPLFALISLYEKAKFTSTGGGCLLALRLRTVLSINPFFDESKKEAIFFEKLVGE
jgi:hypothetical protein